MTLEYFGTDGIRGTAGGEIIHPRFAARLGIAVAQWVKRNCPDRTRVLIGRDPRSSGPELVAGLASGLASSHLRPRSLGILPTPALALAVIEQKACLGIMVTASHNPAKDNGFKLFDHQGHKLSPADEAVIEGLLPGVSPENKVDIPDEADSLKPYLDHLAKVLPPSSLSGWNIALDTAHGATALASRIALERLGSKVEQIGDGTGNQLINDGVGSENPEGLAKLVRENDFSLGVAHDGDGDRVVFCDERGDVVEGDCILGILALDAKRRGVSGSSKLITTVYANHGLDHSLGKEGISVERTDVGDRCVAASMRQTRAAVGGEPSGHLILSEWSPAGDGPLAALNLIRIMLERQRALSELKQCVTLFPSFSGAFAVAEKIPLEEIDSLKDHLAQEQRRLGSGRVFVRYSGTESKIRLLVEAKDETLAHKVFASTQEVLRKELKFL